MKLLGGAKKSFSTDTMLFEKNILTLSELINHLTQIKPKDTLEFDIYFAKEENIVLNIDITYGDAMACEFSVEAPNKVKVVEYTSYHSKFDPSNTVFALVDESLQSFINFLNMFSGMKLKKEDFKFLDQYDDYLPN